MTGEKDRHYQPPATLRDTREVGNDTPALDPDGVPPETEVLLGGRILDGPVDIVKVGLLRDKQGPTAAGPTGSAPTGGTRGRSLRRQFLACASTQTVALLGGVCIAYSSSLIPALSEPDSEIPLTRQQGAWIASSLVLAVPLGSMLGLVLNDMVGRLSLIRSVLVPYAVGWVLIASAGSLLQIIAARLLLGAALGLFHSISLLYISEVAEKDLRGGVGASGTAFASGGILLCYAMGAVLDWRTHAWVNCALPLLPVAAMAAMAVESPVWLKDRARDEDAAKASAFLYDDPHKVLSTASKVPSKNGVAKTASAMGLRTWRILFTEPRGYKPLIVVNAIFIIQQLVGIYITIYFAVPLFMTTGSELNPYIASILIGAVRLVGCTSVALIMNRFGRRPLMLVSSAGQAVSMATSGYATMRILQGDDVSSMWVVGGILAYIVLGCVGWQMLPWTMMAELFPHEVRSLAQPINSSMAHVYMFGMLQLYPTLQDLLGGAAGIQYLFAAASALSAVFVVVWMPETRGRTLQEIEEYFRDNSTYLTEKRRKRERKKAQAGNGGGGLV